MGTSNVIIGGHVKDADPLDVGAEIGAQVVQFFLSDPQDWKKPEPRADRDRLVAAPEAENIAIYIHSPYRINLASTNNRIRIPSRKLLAQHAAAAAEIGARGLIVHGGHVTKDDDQSVGIDNWRKAFAEADKRGGFELPILIENTAGGDKSMARRLEQIDRLWDAIGQYQPAFCLDTCHAHAGGIDLLSAVEKITAITGKIDLIHCNDSRDEFDSGRDRHATIGKGQIDPQHLVEVIKAADCPVVCETPLEHITEDINYLRSAL